MNIMINFTSESMMQRVVGNGFQMEPVLKPTTMKLQLTNEELQQIAELAKETENAMGLVDIDLYGFAEVNDELEPDDLDLRHLSLGDLDDDEEDC